MARRRTLNPTQKPPLGSRIDWGHPLARGLVGCWLFNGTVANVARIDPNALSSGDVADQGYLPSAAGGYATGCLPTLTDNKVTFAFSGGINATTPASQIIAARSTAWILSFRGTFGNTLGNVSWTRYPPTGSNNTTRNSPEGSIIYRQDNPVMFVVGVSGQCYIRGKQVALSGATWGPPYMSESGIDMVVGNVTVGGASALTRPLQYLYIWDDARSAGDALWLYSEPYAMIQAPEMPIFYSIPAGGSSIAAISAYYARMRAA